MADKKNDIKTSKGKIQSTWLVNALKSVGSAGTDVIKGMMPATTDTIKSVSAPATELAVKLRQNRSSNRTVITALKNNPVFKMGQDFFKNAAEEIATGELYNPEKSASAWSGGGDDSELGPDDVSFGDMGGDDSSTSINIQNNTYNEKSDNTSIKAMQNDAKMEVNTAKAVVDSMVTISTNSMIQAAEISGNVLTHLSSIDSNIRGLLEYSTNNVNKFIEASIAYYQQSSQPNQTVGGIGAMETEKTAISVEDLYDASGALNFGKYAQYVKANAKDALTNEGVGAMVSMALENKEIFTANPIGFILTRSMEKLVPEVTQKAMAQFDESFKNFIPSLLERIGGLEDTQDPNSPFFGMTSFISRVFGIKSDRGSGFDFSKIQKGPVPYNGIANHTIVEIIPKYLRESNSYLREIAQAVTGKNSSQMTSNASVFDWNSGKYKNIKDLEYGAYEQIMNAVSGSYSSSAFGKTLDTLREKLNNEDDKRNYTSALNELYMYLDKQQGPLDFKNDPESLSKIIGSLNYSDDIKNVIQAGIESMIDDGGIEIGSLNTAKRNGNIARKRMIQQLNDSAINNGYYSAVSDNRYWNYYESKFKPTTSGIESKPTISERNKGVRGVLDGTPNASVEGSVNAVSADTSVTGWLKNIYNLLNRGIYVQTKKNILKGKSTSTTSTGTSSEITETNSNATVASKTLSEYKAEIMAERQKAKDIRDENTTVVEGDGIRTVVGKTVAQKFNFASDILNGIMTGNSDVVWDRLMNSLQEGFKKAGDFLATNFINPMKKHLFGEKDDYGYRQGGILGGFNNASKEAFYNLRRMVTGAGYRKADGTEIPDATDEELKDTIIGKVKKLVSDIKDGISVRLFGEKDDDGNVTKEGILGKAKTKLSGAVNALYEGLHGWKVSLFGESDDPDEGPEKTWERFKASASKILPTAAFGAILGSASVGLATIGGKLSALSLGPMGALVGLTGGLLSRSDKFKDWLFGPEGEDGRDGGIISKKTQEFIKANKKFLIGGTALGSITGAITGGGILGTLVGGPLAGAITGLASSLIMKSDMFSKFLFGDEDAGRLGLVKTVKNMFGKFGVSVKKSDAKTAGMLGLGGLAGAVTIGTLTNSGILGLSLGVAGPIGGALLGLGTAMLAQKDNFKEWLFGTTNEDGTKRLGILGKFGNMLNVNVFKPIANDIVAVGRDFKSFLYYDVLEKFNLIIKPIGETIFGTISSIAGNAVSSIGDVVSYIKDDFLENVVEKTAAIIEPIQKAAGAVGKALYGVGKSIVKAPVDLLYAITSPVLTTINKTVGAVVSTTFKTIDNVIVKPVKNLVIKPMAKITEVTFKAISAPFKLLNNSISFISKKIRDASDHLAGFFDLLGQDIKDKFHKLVFENPVSKWMGRSFNNVKEFGMRVGEMIKLSVAPVTDFMKETIKGIKDATTDAVKTTISTILHNLNPITWFKRIGGLFGGKGDQGPTTGYFARLWERAGDGVRAKRDAENMTDSQRRSNLKKDRIRGKESVYYLAKDGTRYEETQGGRYYRVIDANGNDTNQTITKAEFGKLPNRDELVRKTTGVDGKHEVARKNDIDKQRLKNQKAIAKWTKNQRIEDTEDNRAMALAAARAKGKTINFGNIEATDTQDKLNAKISAEQHEATVNGNTAQKETNTILSEIKDHLSALLGDNDAKDRIAERRFNREQRKFVLGDNAPNTEDRAQNLQSAVDMGVSVGERTSLNEITDRYNASISRARRADMSSNIRRFGLFRGIGMNLSRVRNEIRASQNAYRSNIGARNTSRESRGGISRTMGGNATSEEAAPEPPNASISPNRDWYVDDNGTIHTNGTLTRERINELMSNPEVFREMMNARNRRVEEIGNELNNMPHFASGTDSAPAGMAVVGEQGPELVRLSGGEEITPAGDTRNIFNRLQDVLINRLDLLTSYVVGIHDNFVKPDRENMSIKDFITNPENISSIIEHPINALVAGALDIAIPKATKVLEEKVIPWARRKFRRDGSTEDVPTIDEAIDDVTIPHFAKGTDSAPAGMAVVGEQGPELVVMNGGEKVVPNHKLNIVGDISNMITHIGAFSSALKKSFVDTSKEIIQKAIVDPITTAVNGVTNIITFPFKKIGEVTSNAVIRIKDSAEQMKNHFVEFLTHNPVTEWINEKKEHLKATIAKITEPLTAIKENIKDMIITDIQNAIMLPFKAIAAPFKLLGKGIGKVKGLLGIEGPGIFDKIKKIWDDTNPRKKQDAKSKEMAEIATVSTSTLSEVKSVNDSVMDAVSVIKDIKDALINPGKYRTESTMDSIEPTAPVAVIDGFDSVNATLSENTNVLKDIRDALINKNRPGFGSSNSQITSGIGMESISTDGLEVPMASITPPSTTVTMDSIASPANAAELLDKMRKEQKDKEYAQKEEMAQAEVTGLTASAMKEARAAENEVDLDNARDDERNGLLASIRDKIGSHNTVWNSIFSKKGLITGGLLLASPLIIKVFKGLWNFIKKFLNKDNNDDNSNPIMDAIGNGIKNTAADFLFAQNGGLGDGKSSMDKVGDTITNAGTVVGDVLRGDFSGAARDFIFDENGNVYNESGARAKLLVKNSARTGALATGLFLNTEKGIGKKGLIKTGARSLTNVGKDLTKNSLKMVQGKAGMADDVVKFLKTFVEKAIKLFEKKTGKKVAAAKTAQLLAKSEKVVAKHFGKISGRIAGVLGMTAGLAATGVGLLAKEGTWIVLGALNGLTGAKRLFRTDEADALMVTISGILGAFAGSTIGSIVDIVNELIVSITGVDFFTEFASILYNIAAGEEKAEALRAAQLEFQQKYDADRLASLTKQYTAMKAMGKIDNNLSLNEFVVGAMDGEYNAHIQSFADYNDEQHKTAGAKIWDALSDGGERIFGKKVKTITDTEKGLTYKDLGDGTYSVRDAQGNDIGIVNKDLVDGDARRSEFTETTDFSDKTSKFGRWFRTGWSDFADLAKTTGSNISTGAKNFGSWFSSGWKDFGEGAKNLGTNIKEGAQSFANSISTGAKNLSDSFKETAIGDMLIRQADAIKTITKGITKGAKELAKETGENIKNGFIVIKEDISRNISEKIADIKETFGYTKKWINERITTVSTMLSTGFNIVKTNVSNFMNSAGTILSSLFNLVTDKIKGGIEVIKSGLSIAVTNLLKSLGINIDDIKNKFNVAKTALKTGADIMGEKISEVGKSIKTSISSIGKKIKNWWDDILTSFKEGFTNIKNKVVSLVKNINPFAKKSDDSIWSKKTLLEKEAESWESSIPGYASGTDNAKKGLALVGEKGPELVMMKGGEKVLPAEDTEGILGKVLNPISNTTSKILNSLVSSKNNIGETLRQISASMVSGDMNKLVPSEGGDVSSLVGNVGKIMTSPVTALVSTTKSISDSFGNITKSIGTNMNKSNSLLSTLANYAKKGNISKILSTRAKLDSNDPLYGVWSTISTINTVLYSAAGALPSIINRVATFSSSMANSLKSKLSTLGTGYTTVIKTGGNGDGIGGRGSTDSNEPTTLNGSTYYSQNDSRWANSKFIRSDGIDDGSTMGDSGCGPTAMSMAMSDMTGKQITPTSMASFAQRSGDRDSTGVNSEFINKAADAVGIDSGRNDTPTEEYISSETKSGNPMVLLGINKSGKSTSSFTKAGHYVVAVGSDEHGKIVINDPRGASYSKHVSPKELAEESISAWSFRKRNAAKPVVPRVFAKLKNKLTGGRGIAGIPTTMNPNDGDLTRILSLANSYIGSNYKHFCGAFGGGCWYWCAAFISVIGNESGNGNIIPWETTCQYQINWFKEHGRWLGKTKDVRIGDIIYYDWNHIDEPRPADHVGIVAGVNGTTLIVIEGNKGNGDPDTTAVGVREISYDDYDIYGFARPAYTEAPWSGSSVSYTGLDVSMVDDTTDNSIVSTLTSNISTLANTAFEAAITGNTDIDWSDKFKSYNSTTFKSLSNTDDEGGSGTRRRIFGGRGKYFSQNDPKWKDTKLIRSDGTDDGSTMGDSGCGPTAMAMALSDMTGSSVSPLELAKYSHDAGFSDETGTNWAFINNVAHKYGTGASQTLSPTAESIQKATSYGSPVILSGVSDNSSTYTTSGHYIVANGMPDGRISIRDPRGASYNKEVTASELAQNTQSMWSIIPTKLNSIKTKFKKMIIGGRGTDAQNKLVNAFRTVRKAFNGEFGSVKSGSTISYKTSTGKTISVTKNLNGFFKCVMKEVGYPDSLLNTSGIKTILNKMVEKGYFKKRTMTSSNMTWVTYPFESGDIIFVESSASGQKKPANGDAIVFDSNMNTSQSGVGYALTGSGYLSDVPNVTITSKNCLKATIYRISSIPKPESIFSLTDKVASIITDAVETNKEKELNSSLNTPDYGLTSIISDGLNTVFNDSISEEGLISKLTSNMSKLANTAFEAAITGNTDIDWDSVFSDRDIAVTTFSNGGTSSDSLNGDSNMAKIYNYFRAKGFTPQGTAGLMGNLKAESGFYPNNVEDTKEGRVGSDAEYTSKVDSGAYSRNTFSNDNAGYGLAQWTWNTRKAGLYDITRGQGKSISDMGSQLDYLYKELSDGGYTNMLSSTTSLQTASNKILNDFESPREKGQSVMNYRAKLGQEVLDQMGGRGEGDTPSITGYNPAPYEIAEFNESPESLTTIANRRYAHNNNSIMNTSTQRVEIEPVNIGMDVDKTTSYEKRCQGGPDMRKIEAMMATMIDALTNISDRSRNLDLLKDIKTGISTTSNEIKNSVNNTIIAANGQTIGKSTGTTTKKTNSPNMINTNMSRNESIARRIAFGSI